MITSVIVFDVIKRRKSRVAMGSN